jgi:SAM-dependent methyltransferase
MLTVARRNPQVTWHQGSATELPFEADVFDVVLCQQGLQFFADRPAAMGEMARVLAPGGRVALSVWGALEHQPFHAAVIAAIGNHLGTEARSAFDSAFSLNTVEELRQLAANAGFRDVHVRLSHRTMRYRAPARLVAGFMGVTPVTPQFLALPDDRKSAFIAHVVEQLAEYTDDDGLAVPQEVRFLTAAKPA